MKIAFALSLMLALFAAPLAAQVYQAQIGGTTYNLEEVFFDGFDKDLSNWRAEGDARVEIEEVRLVVDATRGAEKAATIWCTREFSGPQVVEYDVRLDGSSLQSNVNIFLMASMDQGPGILATSGQRDGSYDQYHTFPNYLVTVLNGIGPDKRERLRVRLRLNPGFLLAAERWLEPLEFGHVYHLAYVIRPPEVSVFLDNRLLCRHAYDKVLAKGLHGLRIWHTRSYYDNFRVSRIVE